MYTCINVPHPSSPSYNTGAKQSSGISSLADWFYWAEDTEILIIKIEQLSRHLEDSVDPSQLYIKLEIFLVESSA